MARSSDPSITSMRVLNDEELQSVVGGAGVQPINPKLLENLIHEDLVGHDSGHNEAGVIAADIVSGAASAKEVISLIESGAAKDGAHSADQQLIHVQSALIKDHDTAANNAFIAEERHRLMDGAAQASMGQLSNNGDLDILDARALIKQEVAASHLGSLLNQDLNKEAATGGSDGLETQIGEISEPPVWR